MDKPWLSQYPAGVPAEVDIHAFASLKDVLTVTCARFAERPAYDSMGPTMSFRQLDEASRATPVRTVVTTQVGDLLPPLKRLLTNAVVKHVKKLVPPWRLEGAVSFLVDEHFLNRAAVADDHHSIHMRNRILQSHERTLLAPRENDATAVGRRTDREA